jgi:hypothetical protein
VRLEQVLSRMATYPAKCCDDRVPGLRSGPGLFRDVPACYVFYSPANRNIPVPRVRAGGLLSMGLVHGLLADRPAGGIRFLAEKTGRQGKS